jgi:hypothetical protein
VIDLRTAAEREAEPNAVPGYPQLADVKQLLLPVVEDFEGMPDSAIGGYLSMLERGGGSLVAAIKSLAEPEPERTALSRTLLREWES